MSFTVAYDVTLLNIDTLMMILFDLHCTCTTSFDGSTVYFIVTGIKRLSKCI